MSPGSCCGFYNTGAKGYNGASAAKNPVEFFVNCDRIFRAVRADCA